jgi:hypothetical protein
LKTIILPGNGICSALREKGGKEKELPVHHKLEELLDQYLKVTGLEKEPGRTWNEFDTKRNLSTVKNDWANFH